MNPSSQKSWNALASPSNMAMAALVGFLFVGQATDWKILFGRKSQASTSVRFGAPGLAGTSSGAGTQNSRHDRAGSVRSSAKSDLKSEEVADRRPATHEAKQSQGELD